ncbi:unnamed protein product, partial [Ectocarpus sp. 4 AP-2014]
TAVKHQYIKPAPPDPHFFRRNTRLYFLGRAAVLRPYTSWAHPISQLARHVRVWELPPGLIVHRGGAVPAVPQEHSGTCEGVGNIHGGGACFLLRVLEPGRSLFPRSILAFLSGGEVDARRRAEMSAAVSHAPASAASAAATLATANDVEAPTLDPTRDQLRPGGHATTSGDAAAVELATDLDAGDAAAPAGGAQLSTTPRALEGSSLSFLAGLAAIISTIFILGDLLNKRMLHPASIVVFLLSVSYCVAMLRRQWVSTGGGTREGRNNNFTKEAREELITYFVFGVGPEELPTEAGAGAEA